MFVYSDSFTFLDLWLVVENF